MKLKNNIWIKNGIPLVIIVLFLVIVAVVLRDPTVDFSGTIENITRHTNGEITFLISGVGGEYTVVADEKTKYEQLDYGSVSSDDVWIGDQISGNFRTFDKQHVRYICIASRDPEFGPKAEYNTCAEWGGGEFCVRNGMLYARGQDTLGLIGDDPTYYKEWTQIQRVDSNNIVHLDVCGGTIVFLTADGKVYGFGNLEGVFAKEAYSATDARARIMTPELLMEECEYVSIGTGFVLLLKQDHTLWFMGHSKNGQSTQIIDWIATPVQIAENVVFIKAFGYTSAWITESCDLYLCGDNSYGQIGNGAVGSGFPTLYQDIVTTPYRALTDCLSLTVESTDGFTVTAQKLDGTVCSWGQN